MHQAFASVRSDGGQAQRASRSPIGQRVRRFPHQPCVSPYSALPVRAAVSCGLESTRPAQVANHEIRPTSCPSRRARFARRLCPPRFVARIDSKRTTNCSVAPGGLYRESVTGELEAPVAPEAVHLAPAPDAIKQPGAGEASARHRIRPAALERASVRRPLLKPLHPRVHVRVA